MAGPQTYSKAPITDAILDIRIERAEPLIAADLEKVRNGQESLYPNCLLTQTVTGIFDISGKEPDKRETRPNGFQFSTADSNQIVNVSVDGFNFDKRSSYPGWNSFSAEARRWWNFYRDIASPDRVTRLALRYINKLELPLPMRDLADYLSTRPEIGDGIPSALAGFFMQLQLPQVDIGAKLTLNQTLIPSDKSEIATVLLDIDIYQDQNVPQNEDDIWHSFGVLRTRKNAVFEHSITEQMKGLVR